MDQFAASRGRDWLHTLLPAVWAAAFCCASAPATASSWQGTLASDTTWGPQQSPCTVIGELEAPGGVTLTILPGTTVLFPEGAKMVIRGRLVAEGTADEPIRFTRAGDHGRWLGVQFKGTTQDNRIRHAQLEYARTDDGMIGLEKSRLLLEHVELDHCDRRRIRTVDSSLIVRHCRFEDIFGPEAPPTTDNMSEHLWGSGIPEGGWLIVEGNVFGRCKGHNDAIDFDGLPRPHPIPHIRNNVFLGGGDDAMDLKCDALVEGNVFTGFAKDRYNKASGESNVLSAGAGMHYVLSHNLFVDVQHVAQVKNDAFLTFRNNTAVNISGAAIYFDLDLPFRKPGHGAVVENSIFWRASQVFAGVMDETELAVNWSCLPSPWHSFGVGNMEADPLFVEEGHRDPNGAADNPADDVWIEGDYHLKSQAGRWETAGNRWIADDISSPCIDAGDPNADRTAELWPHGRRINLGAYGGTAQAAMSLSVGGSPADFDHNGAVNPGDLFAFAANWLVKAAPLAEDIDRDGSVQLGDFARLAGEWRLGPGAPQGPLDITLGRRAKWSPRHPGFDPNLPGYHIVGDIASATLRARTDDLPNRLILAIRTSPGGTPMLEGFTFAAPCVKIEGEPIKGAGLTVYKRSSSIMPWQADLGVPAETYFTFAIVGDEVHIAFLPPAVELLKMQCRISWVDWYR